MKTEKDQDRRDKNNLAIRYKSVIIFIRSAFGIKYYGIPGIYRVTIRWKGEHIMKVQNITDIDGLFKVIDECKGRVELVTGEGDRLNLKSKLSQYVSMANIFSNGEIPELELIAYEKEDTDRLINFMINGGK